MLVAIENLSYEEAAAVMQCQIGTVKSRVWRAREQLARMLGYDGAEVGSDGVVLSAMSGQSCSVPDAGTPSTVSRVQGDDRRARHREGQFGPQAEPARR